MKRTVFGLMAAAAFLFGSSQPAEATFFISISDGTTTVSCTIGGPCDAGFIQLSTGIVFNGSVGTYSIFTDSSSSNVPGTATVGLVTNSSTSVTNTGGLTSTLTIITSVTGFTAPPAGNGLLGNTGSASYGPSTAGDNYTIQSWVDTSGVLHTSAPVAGGTITTAGPCAVTSTGGFVASSACTNPLVAFSNSTPYSLTQLLTFFIAPNQSGATINSTGVTAVTSTPVPEPATLLLLGGGLLGIGA